MAWVPVLDIQILTDANFLDFLDWLDPIILPDPRQDPNFIDRII
jgi:hypothetical protein